MTWTPSSSRPARSWRTIVLLDELELRTRFVAAVESFTGRMRGATP
ncbi:hypothetical protein [Kibdelosporangium phytohabitans]|nr:hypothetical protein [Kibdelosporangium phytohabitans]MBE1463503.1 hypothetical protein [Kibdelosporangium phytohabitans]